jgi:DNA uptake protein ComE-like DNA-binding protein/outer membrane protein assembly factor BamB
MRVARAFSFLAFAAAAAAAASAQQPAAAVTKADFDRLCGTCHEPERGLSSRRTRDHWLQTVNQMVGRGAQGTDDELMGVVEYLTREHGRVNVNLASAAEIALVLGLTPAEGMAIVEHRHQRGTFEDAASVERVAGIDAKKIAARRDAMVFGSRVASNTGRVPVAALTAANNWPGVNGGPQREGWARPEAMLARNTVGAVQLLYSRKLDDRARGTRALTPPLVLGNLISYRGFKEMLFVGGGSDTVYSVDAVLNRVLWTANLPVAAHAPASQANPACPGGLMGIVMTGSAAGGLGGGATIRRPGAPPPGVLPAAATAKSPLVVGLASGFGRNGILLAVGSDGNVYPLLQSNGAVFGKPIPFLPAHSSVRSVNLYDYTLYAATIDGCSGPNAVYALDLGAEGQATAKFETGDSAQGSAGTAVGNDGTVYVHAGARVIALTSKELKEKDYFAIGSTSRSDVTPLVFRHDGKDLVVAGTGDGDLFVLDSTSLGGTDHRTPLARARAGAALRGAFASWEDPDTNARWIYAPLPGAISAFKLDQRDGKPTLTHGWTSGDIVAPAAPVVANGLVYGLSTGTASKRATLYILDAATGKPLFTSSDGVTGTAQPDTSLAVANGRVYFTTQDNTVYSFGIPTEH